MKILIVGGGVAGTALAGFMKDHADITLIDQAPKWGDIGYAVALWGNGQKILQKLNIYTELQRKGYAMPWDMFETSAGVRLKKISWNIFKPYGGTLITTRTDLHKALISTLDDTTTVRLGTTVKAITQRGSIATVTFSDDRKEAYDLVIGADGIRSRVRELTFGKNLLKGYGWDFYVFWTASGQKIPKGGLELGKGGKICMLYPMKDRAVVVLGVSQQYNLKDVPEKRREILQELFKDFDTSVIQMIDAIEEPTRVFYDKLSYVDLQDWYKGRVVLMGDAQHATSPIIGMGVSMALEDASVLADELKKIAEPHDIPNALKAYAARRAPRVKKYRQTSEFFERWIMTKSSAVTMLRDVALPRVTDRIFTRPMEKILVEEI